jgi:sporulation protein YlmC with PRC-barrel domain
MSVTKISDKIKKSKKSERKKPLVKNNSKLKLIPSLEEAPIINNVSNNIIWVSYLDDDGKTVEGYFPLIKETAYSIKIQSKKNIITIPFQRINKIKEKL